MSNMNNVAVKAAPTRRPPTRTPEREQLHAAIERRTAAEEAVEAGKRSVVRLGDAVGAAERKVEAARLAVTEAGERDACAMAEAAAGGQTASLSTRAALTRAEDAAHELAASEAAHKKLRARQKDLEAALLSAQSRVTENVHRVIRTDAGALLARAQEAAQCLRELLPVLHFMHEPRRESPSTPMSPSSNAGFEELSEAISKFVENPRSKPDDWYGAPVEQWRAARVALMNDADFPLPALPGIE